MRTRAVQVIAAAALLILLSLACASWFFKHQASKMTLSTTQASQPPAAIKLSDSYATAALFALIKIESDESVPVIRDGKEYVNRATGDAIDVANANAVSVDKKQSPVFSQGFISDKLKRNQYQDVIFSGVKLNDKQIKAVFDAQIAISSRDKPCFDALDSALHAPNPMPCSEQSKPTSSACREWLRAERLLRGS
jgi:hypothetical protein